MDIDNLLTELDKILPSKVCRTCKQSKKIDCFNRDASREYGRSNQCRVCYSEYHKSNKSVINARRELNRNKESVERKREYHKHYLMNNRDKVKNKHLKSKYGISLDQFMEMVNSQNGKCKICKDILAMGRFTHIDHCHRTGKVRGVLCHKCNTKLGWYEKNSTEVDKYLREYSTVVQEYLPSYALLH